MIAIAIHGGAGLIRRSAVTPEREARARASLARIVALGHDLLARGASAMDAAVAAVVALEEDPLFNAGRGAVLNREGEAEHDAAVMDGATREAGAVAAVRRVRNPIALAHAVMTQTPHVLMAGPGADALGVQLGLEQVEPAWYVTEDRLAQLERARKTGRFHLDHGSDERDAHGTVGAVTCDREGHLAAATSTGGMVNKLPGRVGDTPVIGAGTFAWDATCAVSGTGHGEPLIRLGLALRVSARMELLGEPVGVAAEQAIEELAPLGGQAGLIAVDATGRIAMPFNTAGMFRASQRGEEPAEVAIW